MIPFELLEQVNHIIVHKDCPDGTTSAMILGHVLPRAKISFIQYTTDAHKSLKAEPGMLFCDFSPYLPRKKAQLDGKEVEVPDFEHLSQFVEARTIVLDHHKTAKPVVEHFGELGIFGDETTEPGICGAVLAYQHVWKPLMERVIKEKLGDGNSVSRIATLAGIRDTWQKHDSRWLQACEQAEALFFWPWSELAGKEPSEWEAKLAIGPVLFKKKLDKARETATEAYRFTTPKGTRVVIFGNTYVTSDAADILGEEADLVVGFSYKSESGNIKLVFSTRSHTTFDCATFCKTQNGGGGHTKAAGFTLQMQLGDPNPFDLFHRILLVYEARDGG